MVAQKIDRATVYSARFIKASSLDRVEVTDWRLVGDHDGWRGNCIESFFAKASELGSCEIWMHGGSHDAFFSLLDYCKRNGLECDYCGLNSVIYSLTIGNVEYKDPFLLTSMSLSDSCQAMGVKVNGRPGAVATRELALALIELCEREAGCVPLTLASLALRSYKCYSKEYIFKMSKKAGLIDAQIRRAFRGGFVVVWATPGKVYEGVHCLDVNSAYVARALEDMLPVGMHFTIKNATLEQLTDFTFKCYYCVTFAVNSCSVKQGKRSFLRDEGTDYSIFEGSCEPWIMQLGRYDFEHFCEDFDYCGMQIIDVVAWNCRPVMRGWLEKQNKLKESAHDAPSRFFAKRSMVSLIGKLAQRRATVEDCWRIGKNDALERSDEPMAEPGIWHYLPAAMAVTDLQRRCLRNMVNLLEVLGCHCLYCDNDSVYFTGCDDPAELLDGYDLIDAKKVGKWKVVYSNVRAKFLRAKLYAIEVSDGSIDVKAAGIIDARRHVKSLDDLYFGACYTDARRVAKLVPGGVAVFDYDYFVKEKDDAEELLSFGFFELKSEVAA